MLAPGTPSLESLLQGADIHDLLENNLVEADYPGANTWKFFVEGRDDLLVRMNPDQQLSDARNAAAVFNQLPGYTIDAVPYHPVEHNREVYVVTQKVIGQTLLSALQTDAGSGLVKMADDRWEKLTRYFTASHFFGSEYADDIVNPSQYMVGSVSTDPESKIRLTDLGEYTVNPRTAEPHAYADQLLDIASAIVGIEEYTPEPLQCARNSLGEALQLAAYDTPSQRLIIDATRRSLEEHVRLFFDPFEPPDEGTIRELSTEDLWNSPSDPEDM